MKKRMLALGLALTLTLSLTPALAAGTADKFPAKNAWTGFSDVADNRWDISYIKICFETGLMTGKGGGFDPDGTVTIAEALSVAARVGAALRGDTIPASTDGTWYGGAVAYLKSLPRGGEIALSGDLGQNTITRWGLCLILSIAVPEDALVVKNSITSLPDTDDADVLRLYNAGVLTGVNDYGTFLPGHNLTRSEMAAMVARVARSETALAFTPKTRDDADFDVTAYYTSVPGIIPAITGKDYTITTLDYVTAYIDAVNEVVVLCGEQGIPFSWDLTVDSTPLPDYAITRATYHCLSGLWKAQYGGGEVAAATALGARHILVETKAEADAIRAQLKAAGDSVAKFEELMKQLDGTAIETAFYTFGPDYMVDEFENAVKALKIGEVSEPVQSEFGWHVIQRAEPTAEDLTEMPYKDWLAEQNFQYSEMILNIDLPGFYDNYTADLK